MHFNHFNLLLQSIGFYFHVCLSELKIVTNVVSRHSHSHSHSYSHNHNHSHGHGSIPSSSPNPKSSHARPILYETLDKYTPSKHESNGDGQKVVVVEELHGTLTRSTCTFPYFMLVAFEAGSPLRGLLLLLLWPFIALINTFLSQAIALQMLIFISMAGLRMKDLEGVGRAVLSRFYLQDLRGSAYKVFMAHHRRCVVTCFPRVVVEDFCREYLGAEMVLGTELHSVKGICTGLVSAKSGYGYGYGFLVDGTKKREVVKMALHHQQPHLGMSTISSSHAVLSLCKEGYVVTNNDMDTVPREEYLKPLIFHDGRLVKLPTPMTSLVVFLWFPIGLTLSVIRLLVWSVLPSEVSIPLSTLLGVRLQVKGSPPLPTTESGGDPNRGMLYVCTHRTLLDPIFLSVALRRRVTAVTYSLSRLSELLSPIKTVRLTRCREKDARTIDEVLRQGDLVICPEGTTCREPYLLRYSPLFAEITNDIVPVGINVEMGLFHGTTARGFKAMDPFYFLMNPRPTYCVTIMEPLRRGDTCASGKTSVEVANHIQKVLGGAMGYECTNLTRRDKYKVLAGNDGIVRP